jgi:hypothetical protein
MHETHLNAIPARDQKRVRHSQERQILAKRQVLGVQAYNGLICQGGETGFDMGHRDRNIAYELAGLQRNLDEHDLPACI